MYASKLRARVCSCVHGWLQMDSDGNGEIDLSEFESWWAAHYSAEEEGGYITSDGEEEDGDEDAV